MDKSDAMVVMEIHGWLSRRPMRFREEVVRRSPLRTFDTGERLYNAGDGFAGMLGSLYGRRGHGGFRPTSNRSVIDMRKAAVA